ncbi:hypothetical protein BGZ83_000860 [Gryganskiella cystojenkinii]|nr:hypothetical protein BGZ83_000860 [Gryganskiella cystojenkinii]
MASVKDESFPQNTDPAKRLKAGQKRKQPDTTIPSANNSSNPLLVSAVSSVSPTSPPTFSKSKPGSGAFVYQQPKSLQHHQLPSQPIQFDSTALRTFSVSEAVNVVHHSSKEDLEHITNVLTEATLNNIAYFGPSAAMVTGTFNDEDLWGPQLGAASTEGDVLVPEEMQILPDESTRQYLASLYYKNHFLFLPMVQREVLRVCEENIHIPHCLLLCNAVYYCGSMFSTNTLTLRKDVNDESTLGEDFFSRGQVLLEKKFLTTHICTVQALLFFAIGHKSPAQRSAFISQAITMALDMGLHTRVDDSVDRCMRSYRARIFWCCYLFDSSASAINGKPALINDEEVSVDMLEAGDLGPENETFSDRYFIHCLHGWQICRKIRKNSKLMVRQPPPPQDFLLKNLSRLDNELVEWQQHLPKVFEYFPSEGSMVSDISSLCASTQLLCCALVILLHHPYLPNPKSPEAFQPPAPGSKRPDSQGYCTQAAKTITKIGGILLKEAPKTYEQSTPSRYALNFAIRIHLRNSKCTIDSTLAKESRRDLQKTMDYIERVENLQFFRINRAKKSDVADLLASCRAALAQQKSGLDMAKEAAALKHRQMLLEKQVIKEKQRQQQEALQVQKEHNFQNMLQPVLASQTLPATVADDTTLDLSEVSLQDAALSPQQILLSMQATQQHSNIQQQTYKQQQLHLQMYTHERTQQELARLNHLQRQGQLDVDNQRHQHFQQLALAQHKQQIFMQQQQQLHHNNQHHHRLAFAHNQQQHAPPHPSQDFRNPPITKQTAPGQQPTSTGPLEDQNIVLSQASFHSTDFQDPAAFSRLSPTQQQQLFMAFSQSLGSSQENFYYSNPTVSHQDSAAQSGTESGTAAERGQNQSMGNYNRLSIGEIQPDFANISVCPSSESSVISASFFGPSNPVATHPPGTMEDAFSNNQHQAVTHLTAFNRTNFSNMPLQHTQILHPQQQQQQQQYGTRILDSPESVTEEAILQSWSISTPFDHIYMNPNLAPDDPRNDLGTFTYMPSEFEYGDAPALSPTASSVSEYAT